jgi:hypothetical protein
MFTRNINAHIELFKTAPSVGEKMTLGTREFQIRRVGRSRYQLVETFFA